MARISIIGVWKYVACLVVVPVLFEAAAAALNDDTPQVVEGRAAIIRQNHAVARDKAIQDALRKALEQALLESLDPFVLVEYAQVVETRLYARAINYIRSYRVLWEYPNPSKNMYQVGLEVFLAPQEVAKELQTIGLTQLGDSAGRLLVLMIERHLERPQASNADDHGGIAASTIRSHLQAQNFQTVTLPTHAPWDGRESSAIQAGKQAGVGIVLIGEARAEKVRSDVAGMALQTVHASVRVKALSTATGQHLAGEYMEATALHADAVLGGTQALRKAAAEVAARLVQPLRDHQQRHHHRIRTP